MRILAWRDTLRLSEGSRNCLQCYKKIWEENRVFFQTNLKHYNKNVGRPARLVELWNLWSETMRGGLYEILYLLPQLSLQTYLPQYLKDLLQFLLPLQLPHPNKPVSSSFATPLPGCKPTTGIKGDELFSLFLLNVSIN